MKHYHKNPRQITAAQFQRLQETLSELGDLSGIVHDLNSDEIIGGNQRLEALGLMNATPEIVERHDPPTETGTVALGYYIVNGERFSYRAVRWTPAQCEKANIVANLAGGDWNWDALASWDVSALVSWGFDTEALQGWNNDAANLALMIGAEAETEGEIQEEVNADPHQTLADRFGVPPFSVLDARQGYWQERKSAWIALGIKSELGRGEGCNPPHGPTVTQNADGTLCGSKASRDGWGEVQQRERGTLGAIAPNETGEHGILASPGKYAVRKSGG